MATAEPPQTTIVPFSDQSKLPACAAACGPLYDANGACVPPAIPQNDLSAYQACFCADTRVAGFSTAATGVCAENACPQTADLVSIQSWFQGICSVDNNAAVGTTTDGAGATTTGGGTSQTGSGSGSNSGPSHNSGGGGDWLSGHWQWVVMIVVIVVAIVAIWIGACIWRRRYLKKKDRHSSLGQKHSGSASHPSWGPAVTGSDSASPVYGADGANAPAGSNGVFMPSHAAAASDVDEKPKKTKKKWRVSERT